MGWVRFAKYCHRYIIGHRQFAVAKLSHDFGWAMCLRVSTVLKKGAEESVALNTTCLDKPGIDEQPSLQPSRLHCTVKK